jgi:NDP-sugar pyrophosphorylase family protein
MKAMVLAAGLGTRLRPLTNDRPKALVEVDGRTMLEITVTRLREFGVRHVIVNVHHFAEKVIEFLRANDNFGMHIEISREDVLLDTGGGLKKAAWFLGDTKEPFLLHNVDVVSTIDLRKMLELHNTRGALATMAVQDRRTARYLLFDESDQLCGRRAGEDGKPEFFRTAEAVQALAFAGVHVISPKIFPRITEVGVFPIIPAYLRLAGEGESIIAFHADQFYWRDLGKPESVAKAADELRRMNHPQ